MTEQDYQKLIPILKTVNEGKPLAIEIWLDWIGEPAHAIAYSTLFWPEFIEHQGCVFRGIEIPSTYQEWKEKFQGNMSSIEKMLNHEHISDLFWGKKKEPEQVLFLGKKLKESWSAKLKQDFPNKKFVVEFDENFKFGIDNPEITFYQIDKTLTTDK